MPQIQRMQEADIPEAAALERACFSEPWSEASFLTELRGGAVFFAAFEQGRLAGYAGMQVLLDEGGITNVAVDASFRRRGIARALVGALLEYGDAHALASITLEVRESNAPAIALYEGYGFAPVGRRRGFYSAPREDAVLMTKYLKEGAI